MKKQDSDLERLEKAVGFYESKLQDGNVDQEGHKCFEKMASIIKDFDDIKRK